VRLLRFASIAICLIVIASFITFAADEAKTASGHQQELLGAAPKQVAIAGSAQATSAPAAHKSTLHRTIDEASSELTSPFSSVLSAASGEWAIRGFKLIAALIVYGFGLGYLARALRVRV